MAYQIPVALSPIQPSRIPLALPVPPSKPFVVLKELGEGAFGKVLKIQRHSDKKILALKKVKVSKSGKRNAALEAECRIHCSLDHPYIVKVDSYEYDDKKEYMHIYMEVCEGGDLDAFIADHRARNEPLEEETIWKLFSQLVQALHYCHDPSSRANGSTKAILHRDLKPANIFMTKDHKQVRLGDFGLARELETYEYAKSNCGTDEYLAPEVHSNEQYRQSADIFSLGAILYELCTLHYLVQEGSGRPPAREQILAGVDTKIPWRYSAELARVVKNMLLTEEMHRPSTQELMRMIGINWGKAATTADKDQRAIMAVHKQLRLQKNKSAELEDKVRELGRKLEQAQQSVKTRKAALDVRERALNNREANLKAKVAQAEARIKKDLEARERQLLQDRLAFAASSRQASLKGALPAGKDRSDQSSERSTAYATTNTASAVSSALRVASNSASVSLRDANLISGNPSPAPTKNQGLHRVPKRYNLRSQAIPSVEAADISGEKPVSLLPKRKLRSDGDLEDSALRQDDKENNASAVLGDNKTSCKTGGPVAAIQKKINKPPARVAKAPMPSGIPIYHLRSAAAKCNGALQLRRAGL